MLFEFLARKYPNLFGSGSPWIGTLRALISVLIMSLLSLLLSFWFRAAAVGTLVVVSFSALLPLGIGFDLKRVRLWRFTALALAIGAADVVIFQILYLLRNSDAAPTTDDLSVLAVFLLAIVGLMFCGRSLKAPA